MATKAKSVIVPERAIQRQVCEYFRLVLPDDVLWFHPSNEGKRGLRAQWDFKLGGGLAGVADLMLSWAHHKGPWSEVAWIELKSATGRISPEQSAFRDRVRSLGHYHCYCRSLDDVRLLLSLWGVPLKPHSQIKKSTHVRAPL